MPTTTRRAILRRKVYRGSVLAPLIESIGQVDRLTHEEVCDLARRVKAGDIVARDRLFQCNVPLLVNIARTFYGRGLALEDLVQEGAPALLLAIERFDPDSGFCLSTYATHYICGFLQRALKNAPCNFSRVPCYLADADAGHRWPKQVAAAQRLRSMVRYDPGQISNLPAEDDGRNDTKHAELTDHLLAAVNQLPERAAFIVRRRFGIGCERETLETVGRALGITRERVRQLEGKALAALRSMLDPDRDQEPKGERRASRARARA